MELISLRKIFPKKSSQHHRSFNELFLRTNRKENSTLQIPSTQFFTSDLSRSISNKSITFATIFDDLQRKSSIELDEKPRPNDVEQSFVLIVPNEIRSSNRKKSMRKRCSTHRMKKSRSAPNLRCSPTIFDSIQIQIRKKNSFWKSTRQWMKSSLIGRWICSSSSNKNSSSYHPSSELIY